MNSLLEDLEIDESYTKSPKVIYDRVAENTLPLNGYNYMMDLLFLPETKQKYNIYYR
jgi:hypothetical protein